MPPRPTDAGGRSGSTLRVLVVDDSHINREACSALLSQWGVEPVLACDGAQALELVRQRRFDLVLMDLRMPVMDGLAATAQIRQLERQQSIVPGTPVIAYTSDEVAPDVARKAGLNGVLRKPSSATALGECLRTWCGSWLELQRPPTA